MNKLTNIQTPGRPFQDVVRVAAPSGVINSFAIRRRELVRTWTINSVSGRLGIHVSSFEITSTGNRTGRP